MKLLLMLLVLLNVSCSTNRTAALTKIKSSTVTITRGQSGGSGFHITAPSGKVYILTNAHVCRLQKAGKVLVTSNIDNRQMSRSIIAVYKDHDLCLVEALPGVAGLKPAKTVDILERIMVAGNPGLRPFTVQEAEIIDRAPVGVIDTFNGTEAECTGKYVTLDPIMSMFTGVTSYCIQERDSFRTNLIAYGGNSGSAVLNTKGEVIGVLYAGSTQVLTDQMLVPLDFIRDFLKNY